MTALWCAERMWISRQSGGASIRRGLAPSSSCSIPAIGSLSPACSKATACWLAGPGGYFAGATILSRAEYKMALRLRLLRSPASLDVGDAEGGIVCRCNRRIDIIADPMHFFHCPSSQGQFIRRHNHIRDAIMDQIGDAIDMRSHEGPHIEVEWESLVLAHVSLTLDPPPSPPRADEAMEVEAIAPRFANGDED